MKAQKLVVYLMEMIKGEQRVEIGREILAQNMNFSPAWILAQLLQAIPNEDNSSLQVSHFAHLFSIINLKCSKVQAANIFEYFDIEKKNKVSNQHFVDILMPTTREGLRKAVAKRGVEDLEWSKDLKYAFRRFFSEVQSATEKIRLYQNDFADLSLSFVGTSTQPLSADEVHEFVKKFGKYLTENELNFVMVQIEGKRLRAIQPNCLINIVRQSLKAPKVPTQSSELYSQTSQSKSESQQKKLLEVPIKTNYANKSTSENKSASGYHANTQQDDEIQRQFKKASVIADRVLSREEDDQTPIHRLPKSSRVVNETPKVHFPSNRKDLNTEFSALQNFNSELKSEMHNYKCENEDKMKKIRAEMKSLGSH